MFRKKSNGLIRVLAVMLAVSLFVPATAMAAAETSVQPCASSYLQVYNTYVWPAGNGKVQVWFTVVGAQVMDELGVLTIILQESTDQSTWRNVATYDYTDYENMLGYNTAFHSNHVDYDGTTGLYYRAYVTIWGGRNGGGDSRRLMTSAELAT